MPDAHDPERPTDPSAPPEPVQSPTADRFEAWWEGLPRPVRVGLTVAGIVLVGFLVRVLPDLLFGEGSTGWQLYMAGFLVLIVLGMWLTVRAARRRLGGREQLRLFRRALKTGEVPPQANREAWLPAVERLHRASSRQRRWYLWTSVIPLSVITVAATALILFSDSPAGFKVVGPTILLLLLAGVVLLGRLQNRNLRHAASLREQLRS